MDENTTGLSLLWVLGHSPCAIGTQPRCEIHSGLGQKPWIPAQHCYLKQEELSPIICTRGKTTLSRVTAEVPELKSLCNTGVVKRACTP